MLFRGEAVLAPQHLFHRKEDLEPGTAQDMFGQEHPITRAIDPPLAGAALAVTVGFELTADGDGADMPTALAPMASESDALLRLRTLAAQKNSGRT